MLCFTWFKPDGSLSLHIDLGCPFVWVSSVSSCVVSLPFFLITVSFCSVSVPNVAPPGPGF